MADLVSIIVPVYNAEKTIQRCVESLINQSYIDIQVILVDDGSTDSSLALCKEITNKDSRFIVIEKQNGGVSSARNCGIENSKGKYLMFLDSDDWIDDNMIERYVSLIEDYGSDVVIGSLHGLSAQDYSSFIKNVPVIGKLNGEIWNIICDSSEMFGYIGGKMFKKAIIDAHSIRFNEKMYAQEDLEFCLSYYEVIDCFYLTDYAGYKYFYEKGKRIPPYCDFMRNQLKLLDIAEKKCELNSNAYNKIQQRIVGFVYVMFYEEKNKDNIYDACKQMRMVDGLDSYLNCCKLQGEQKYIVLCYLKGKYWRIFYYFKLRAIVKQIIRRN